MLFQTTPRRVESAPKIRRMEATTASEDEAGDPQSISTSRPRARAISQTATASTAATAAMPRVTRLDTTTVSTSMTAERFGSRAIDSMRAAMTRATSTRAAILSPRSMPPAVATCARPPTMRAELAQAAAAAATTATSPTMNSRPVKMADQPSTVKKVSSVKMSL